ncbi:MULTISPECIES: hypothetical protein [Aliivibrio]|uniref:Uncharacterized protein n=1 Tax=Aliivibrio finisterrensis TaxID=511998 RepID=A0A4V1Z943_9GAMM|nr:MULTISPECIES: hypothetical protein [Aliivibrio]MDD9178437.1 hypothetical protein [Aliivibrio sp. A6]RYU53332.1 hypothetical protein ERW57_04175 [Aliivibrio finisterrensis]RYU65839.1 hypothetical protein ERW53_04695 [Aliivibrio finisterrensis]RYU86630.1 hypothetical protein ERW52_06035 [Aliivibrio finisterrensis]
MFKFITSWPVWAVFQSLVCLGFIFLLVAVVPIFLPDLPIINAPELVINTWLYTTLVIIAYAFVMAVRDRKKELEKEQELRVKRLFEYQVKQALGESMKNSHFLKKYQHKEIVSSRLIWWKEKYKFLLAAKHGNHKMYADDLHRNIYIFATDEQMKDADFLLKEISFERARNLAQFKKYAVMTVGFIDETELNE